jgi:hypothetical protein
LWEAVFVDMLSSFEEVEEYVHKMLETNARAIRVGRGVSVGNADRGGVPASEQTLVSAASGTQICEAWATVTPSTLNVLRVEASKETQGDESERGRKVMK